MYFGKDDPPFATPNNLKVGDLIWIASRDAYNDERYQSIAYPFRVTRICGRDFSVKNAITNGPTLNYDMITGNRHSYQQSVDEERRTYTAYRTIGEFTHHMRYLRKIKQFNDMRKRCLVDLTKIPDEKLHYVIALLNELLDSE